jgi:glycosyltransferase involved in cell wall biosynthesis
MTVQASILISSYERLPLFRRCLWSIANRPPSVPFEVVVVDDGSPSDILGLVRQFSSRFPWTFVRLDTPAFERATGVSRFWNNPSLALNLAARHARGDWLYQQGNEVIAWGDVYDELWQGKPPGPLSLSFSTTFDVPPSILDLLDPYGANLTDHMVRFCARYPLASVYYHSDVMAYVSLCSRSLWETIGGYDERYVGGLGKEDSDFMRRCRAVPGWADGDCLRRSEAVSLHQYHAGRTRFYLPPPTTITPERWAEGERLSKAVWDLWDGSHRNAQPWPWGEYGVAEVIRNGY